jgi:phage terminase small subunit
MSILDKPRHEKLAQELALGTNQTDAYERAGYARDDGHASRLAGDGRIKARVRELHADAAKHIALSRADMIQILFHTARAMKVSPNFIDARRSKIDRDFPYTRPAA